ncbi:MAG: SsrA-binding protein SmpB [Candidatus Velthaea sp.]
MPKMKAARVASKEKPDNAPILDNRRARFEYEIMDTVVSGIALTGTEIKSLRTGAGASINEAYVRIREGEAFLVSMTIPMYKQGSFSNHEPNRARKLLMHREQIDRFAARLGEKGFTLIPLRMFFTEPGTPGLKPGVVKVLIGLARGKKLWDKRRATQERDVKRDIAREMRR